MNLTEERTIKLRDELTPKKLRSAIEHFKVFCEESTQPVYFDIDSIGGSSDETLELATLIVNSPVETVALARRAYSAGAWLFIVCDRRYLRLDGELLFHELSIPVHCGCFQENGSLEQELQKRVKGGYAIQEQRRRLVTTSSKLPESTIEYIFTYPNDDDIIIDPQKAHELGFAEELIQMNPKETIISRPFKLTPETIRHWMKEIRNGSAHRYVVLDGDITSRRPDGVVDLASLIRSSTHEFSVTGITIYGITPLLYLAFPDREIFADGSIGLHRIEIMVGVSKLMGKENVQNLSKRIWKLQNAALRALQETTKLPLEEIDRIMQAPSNKRVQFNAEEAVKYGLAHRIYPPRKARK